MPGPATQLSFMLRIFAKALSNPNRSFRVFVERESKICETNIRFVIHCERVLMVSGAQCCCCNFTDDGCPASQNKACSILLADWDLIPKARIESHLYLQVKIGNTTIGSPQFARATIHLHAPFV